MKRLLLAFLLVGVSLFVGCGGSSGGTTPPATVTLVSITITPSSPSITVGATQQFVATGSYSDGSTKVLTSSANWLSATSSVATINTTGLATSVAVGSTSITATSGSIVGTATLTVTPVPLVSIAVTPATATINPIAPGNTQQFTATGTYGDGSTKDLTSTATWQSSNSGLASINAAGLATAVAPGTVTVTATFNSVSGTATLTVANPLVSIAVTPVNSSSAPGTKPLFTATGTYFDHTTANITTTVTWSSSNTAVATILNTPGLQGQATAVAAGTTTIKATLGTVTGSTTLTVTSATLNSIAVTPQAAPISLGIQQQYTATGTFSDGSLQDITNVATWSSSDTTKVTITTSGLATGVGVTTTPVTITATFKGVSGSTTATVNAANLVSIAITPNAPSSLVLAQGTGRQFTATGTFSNGSTLNISNQATWSSSNAFATVSPHTGQVKAASSVVNPSNSVTITVTLGVVTQQFTLTVTNATPVSITVTPIAATIPVGAPQSFSATGTFSDGTIQDISQDASWASSNTAVATISAPGKVLGKASGSATITASFGGQSGTAQITVSAGTLVSIAVTPPSTTLAPGSTITFQAIGTYTGPPSTANLSGLVAWLSSDQTIVTVSGGVALGQSAGPATITATYQGISGIANVLVTTSPLSSIAIAPPAASVPVGVATQFNAIGTFADSSTQNLTSSVTWSSSQPSVGTVSNTNNRQGIATGIGQGTTDISAVFASVVSTTPAVLTVTNATIQSIAVTPNPASAAAGTPVTFTATGTFSGGIVIDLTGQVSWTSSVATVATINNIGLANAASPGTTNITATFGGVSGTSILTVH